MHVASNVDLLLGHVDLLSVLDVDRVAAHVAQRTLCPQEHTLKAIRCVQRILNGFGLTHPWRLPRTWRCGAALHQRSNGEFLHPEQELRLRHRHLLNVSPLDAITGLPFLAQVIV